MEKSLVAEQVLDGRYRIVRRIATGGMATVYLAEHTLIGRPVAIKVLHPQFGEDEEYVQRFLAEGRTAGTLGHPHIVESTDMGYTASGAPYLVLELLEGSSLSDVIHTEGRFSIDRALTISLQIASAVAAAHAKGIIHRDLKSENIFLLARVKDGDHVKVLDFGISKFTELRGHTQKDKVWGTPWFMPPEQVDDPSSVDARCDVYALGAILYEMLAGQTLFAEAPFPQVLIKILSEEPQPIEKLRPEVGPELADLLHRALAKSPADRVSSMNELGRELAALAGQSWPDIARPARAVSTAPAEPPRRRGVLAGALATVAAIGAAAIITMVVWSGSEHDEAAGTAALPPEQNEPVPPASTASGPVQLIIDSVTRDAQANFRGETYRLPLRARLPRGDRPEVVEVTAPGHDTTRVWITLDRDQALSLDPEPSQEPAPPTSDRRTSRRSGARASKSSGSEPRKSVSARDSKPGDSEPAATGETEPPAEPEETPDVPIVSEPSPPTEPAPKETAPKETAPKEPAVKQPAPGTMDRKATREAVSRHLREIRTCFERGRMDNPQLAGRVLVRIDISPSGKVTSASIVKSDLRSQVVEACITSAVESWTLPQPAGGAPATITYPFSYH